MGAIDEKPDLREQIGVAVGASVLVIDPWHGETPALRVAAMGGAARAIAANEDAPRPVADTPARRSSDELQAALAPLLWRLKYGADATERTARDAVFLFERWLQGKPSIVRDQLPPGMLVKLSAQVILEWLDDKCPACAGTGKQELLRGGTTRRPRRFGDPQVRHCTCRRCSGSGQARPDAMARARALNLSLAEMRDGKWLHRFALAGYWLSGVAGRLNTPLRKQLERGI